MRDARRGGREDELEVELKRLEAGISMVAHRTATHLWSWFEQPLRSIGGPVTS